MLNALKIKRFADGSRVHVDRKRGGLLVKVQLGPGAGYVTWNADRTKVITHGRTLYLAWRSGSAAWAQRNRGVRRPLIPLQVGLTRNANRVPWLGDLGGIVAAGRQLAPVEGDET